MSSKPTKVTNRVRALRFAHDEMKQAELAAIIGVTRQTVIAIEQGKYAPSLELAFRIAHAFVESRAIDLHTLRSTARGTGLWYLALGLSGMAGFLFLRQEIFVLDAARTAANLAARDPRPSASSG